MIVEWSTKYNCKSEVNKQLDKVSGSTLILITFLLARWRSTWRREISGGTVLSFF